MKAFKILTIDGGGIKGLYSSKILEHFESRYKCNISDYFDLLCGTSTGGLIALALSLKIPTTEISKIYSENGSKIFPKKNTTLKRIKQVFGGIYSDKPIKKVLEELFGTYKIKDSNNLLCIPSYNITTSQPRVFKYDHSIDLSTDNELSYVEVALATSAAPTFLPMAEIKSLNNNQFIDGGVWANNPTLVGYLEALKYFVGEGKKYDCIEILSISSLNIPKGKPTGMKRRRGFWSWKGDLFDTSLIGQSFFNDFFMQTIKNHTNIPTKYYRIKNPDISSEQSKYIDMDLTTKKSIEVLKTLGDNTGSMLKNDKEIADFFKNKKTYIPKIYGEL